MPPVSSRTTSRSTPSISWARSGEASARAGNGLTGRRLAYRPRPLRRPSRPCSGRGACGSVESQRGPPTAASRTASAERAAASVSSLSATPQASIAAPPIRCSSKSKSPSSRRMLSVGAMISGPIPSPGRVTMRLAIGGEAYLHARALPTAERTRSGARLDVQPHVVDQPPIAHRVDHSGGELLGKPAPGLLAGALAQALAVVVEAHLFDEVVQLRRPERALLKPAGDRIKAGRTQALRRLLGRGVVPWRGHPREMAREGLAHRHRLRMGVEARDVPCPAALRDQ